MSHINVNTFKDPFTLLAQTLYCRLAEWLDDWWIGKDVEWKWPWMIWGTTSDCAWMNWRNARGFAVRSADLLADIWTLDRLITKLFATNSVATYVGTVIALRFGLGKVLSSNPYRRLLMRVFLLRSPYSPSRMPGSRQPCTTLNRFLRPLLYCSNSCTSLHFKTLKSHTKTLKIRPYVFRFPLKPSWGCPWLYFARLLNRNFDLHSL